MNLRLFTDVFRSSVINCTTSKLSVHSAFEHKIVHSLNFISTQILPKSSVRYWSHVLFISEFLELYAKEVQFFHKTTDLIDGSTGTWNYSVRLQCSTFRLIVGFLRLRALKSKNARLYDYGSSSKEMGISFGNGGNTYNFSTTSTYCRHIICLCIFNNCTESTKYWNSWSFCLNDENWSHC